MCRLAKYVLVGGCSLHLMLGSQVTNGDVVEYEVTFDATWSSVTHPGSYPAGAHFSGLIGGTHNAEVSFWKKGQLASEGMERMAELGSKSPLDQEVQAAIAEGSAFSLISGGGIGPSPGNVSSRFQISATHPLATVVSMVAPSPDWFVGTSGLNLRQDGLWIPEVTHELFPYDSGTDSGPEFRSANDDTNPAEPIQTITGAPFQGTPTLGTFTFRLVSLPGDLNGSEQYDDGDVNLLCSNFGSTASRFDFTDDSLVNHADLSFLVESLIGTRAGDINLDGRVEFDDFLGLSSSFGKSGAWAQGDFDCNGKVDFADFLSLSTNFGFGSTTAAAVHSVPEPGGWGPLGAGLALLLIRRPRR